MSFKLRPVWALAAAFAMSLSSIAFSSGAGASPGGDPTIRLYAATHSTTLYRYGTRVYPDLGAYVAATNGNFQVNVWRNDYGSPVQGAQVDSGTGAVLHEVPSDMFHGWGGFLAFTHLRLATRAGRTVYRSQRNFCPNNWDAQRVSDAGPSDNPYFTSCHTYSPFTKGMVWGIGDEWAVNAVSHTLRLPRSRVPDGRYVATVAIAKPFAQLFGVAPGERKVQIDVTLKSPRAGGGIGVARAAGRNAATAGPDSVPTDTSPDPSMVPDLAALPAWSMGTSHNRHSGKDFLNFAATEWSAGPGRLVVEGFRRQDTNLMDAYQYFYDSSGTPVSKAPVGTFRYDDRRGHHHWHFAQFARYSLVSAVGSGDAVVRSHKQSFCIAPTDAIDLLAPGAQWDPGQLGFGSYCGDQSSIWVREELPTGWGDTYYQYAGGQAFNITNVPNGWYYVEVRVNPKGLLYERDTTNDSEMRLVHLKGRPGHRTVESAPWHGINP